MSESNHKEERRSELEQFRAENTKLKEALARAHAMMPGWNKIGVDLGITKAALMMTLLSGAEDPRGLQVIFHQESLRQCRAENQLTLAVGAQLTKEDFASIVDEELKVSKQLRAEKSPIILIDRGPLDIDEVKERKEISERLMSALVVRITPKPPKEEKPASAREGA